MLEIAGEQVEREMVSLLSISSIGVFSLPASMLLTVAAIGLK